MTASLSALLRINDFTLRDGRWSHPDIQGWSMDDSMPNREALPLVHAAIHQLQYKNSPFAAASYAPMGDQLTHNSAATPPTRNEHSP